MFYYSNLLPRYSRKYREGKSPYKEIVINTKKELVKNFDRIIRDIGVSKNADKVRIPVRLLDIKEDMEKAGYDVGRTTIARTLHAFFQDEELDFYTTRGVHGTIYKPLIPVEALNFWRSRII